MKLIYLTWGYPYDVPIIRAFREIGISVEEVSLPKGVCANYEERAKWVPCAEETEEQSAVWQQWKEAMRAADGDIIFSVNFYAAVSDFCQKETLPYCCWVLQLPDFDLYTEAVKNPCNYLGICDSYLVEKLWQTGVSKAFLLPDAVEAVDGYDNTPEFREIYFIARHPEQALETGSLSMYAQGYLEAFLHAQRVLFGANILENGLLYRVQQEIEAVYPAPDRILSEFRRLYTADAHLAPVCTGMQQNIFLQNFQSVITIYSDGKFENCKTQKHPYPEKEEQRKKLYAEKEFVLVLAPHTLHNGIPRQFLEVIAAGGFPICGKQKDYEYFFKQDENLACFCNAREFQDILAHYGNSYEERERLRTSACSAVAEGHTYRHRVAAMLDMWGKL